MKYKVCVYTDCDVEAQVEAQEIAVFQNVDEVFMDEICCFIEEIRDVYCQYKEIK